jgi:2-hydroxychromene-2-carboxylate isomerase
MSERRTIRFYFDYVSPYSYLAWTQVHALAERRGCEVEPLPVFFAGILNAVGSKGPVEVLPKWRYIFKDVLRTAHLLGVRLRPPVEHPFNSLLALRSTSVPMASEKRRQLIDGLFAAAWAEERRVAEPAVVAEVATAAGLDGATLVQEANTPEAKERVKKQTEEALAAGAFGVPSLLVGQELFWGYDSFPHLERYLEGEDAVDPAWVERWVALNPRAQGKNG